MTEAEWLASTDLKAMLTFLRGNVSDRKLRLFTCACGRRDPHAMRDERDRRILELEERYADGLASVESLVAAYEDADNDPVDARDAAHFDPYLSAYYLDAPYTYRSETIPEDVHLLQLGLLRDVVGNPFRPGVADRSWGAWDDRTVVAVARSIYDHRSFDRLPTLADVLEIADCTNAEVLHHCRSPGPHVRGCWVVDRLLGKS